MLSGLMEQIVNWIKGGSFDNCECEHIFWFIFYEFDSAFENFYRILFKSNRTQHSD